MFTYIRYHYVHLGFLKFRDIVKIYNCLFLYDYASDKSRVIFHQPRSQGLSPTRPMDNG